MRQTSEAKDHILQVVVHKNKATSKHVYSIPKKYKQLEKNQTMEMTYGAVLPQIIWHHIFSSETFSLTVVIESRNTR